MSNDIETSTVTDPGTPPAGDPAETTPQGGTPQGGEGTPAGDGTTPPADWRAGLPEGWGEKLKDVGSAEEALKALERGLGYRPAEKVEDIALKYPDSFKGQIDQGVENGFRQFCVDNGITQDQAQKLLDWQLGANKEITDKIAIFKDGKYMGTYKTDEISEEELTERALAQFAATEETVSVKSITLYIKPEDRKAYYVVNEKVSGSVDL